MKEAFVFPLGLVIGSSPMEAKDIIDFWFSEIEPKQMWQKDEAFDHMVGERFGKTLEQAAQGELFTWRQTPEGRLAEIIVLDQFSRNIFRGQPKSFTQDALALVLAQEAVHCGDDQKVAKEQRSFIYMPYMHSESLVVHNEAVRLFSQPGFEGSLDFEMKHKVIIERFGRYPHRNEILGRTSTTEEIAFLNEPNSSF